MLTMSVLMLVDGELWCLVISDWVTVIVTDCAGCTDTTGWTIRIF